MPAINRLKKIPLFKDLTEGELKKVSSIMEDLTFRKSSVIWEEGSPQQGLHVIDSGRVRVTRRTKDGNNQVLAILKRDSFFGELSLLDGRSHSASAAALEKTKVFVIRKKEMDQFLKKHPKIAYKIVRALAIEISGTLRSMNDKFINMVDYLWD